MSRENVCEGHWSSTEELQILKAYQVISGNFKQSPANIDTFMNYLMLMQGIAFSLTTNEA